MSKMKKAYAFIASILVVLMLISIVVFIGVKQQSVVPVVEKEGTDPNIMLKQVQGVKVDYSLQCFDDPAQTRDCTADLKAGEHILRTMHIARCPFADVGGTYATSKVDVSIARGELIEADGTVVVGKPITLTSECTRVALQKYTIVQRVECNADVDCRTTAVSNTYRTLLGKCMKQVETDPVCVYNGLQEAEKIATRQKTFIYTQNLIPWYAGAFGAGSLAGVLLWVFFRKKGKQRFL